MPNLNQRVAILIDEVNIYRTAQRLHGNVRLNLQAMIDKFSHRDIVRVINYCIDTPENNTAIFQNKIRRMGVEVKTKTLKVFKDGSRKGDWDVGIAVDAVQLAPKVDIVVLATGDGDFEHLVHYLKWHGVRVEVLAFEKRISHELLRSIDEFVPIDHSLLSSKKAIRHRPNPNTNQKRKND